MPGCWRRCSSSTGRSADRWRSTPSGSSTAQGCCRPRSTWRARSSGDEALASLDRAIVIDPEFRDAYYERAFLQQWTFRNSDKAITDYERANDLSIATAGQGDAKALRMLGDLWRDRIDGKADQARALACYEQAAAIDPVDPNCRLAQAIAIGMQGDSAKALSLVADLAQADTGMWEVHYAHGLLLVGSDRRGVSTIREPRWREAAEAMGKAIELMPTRANLYNNRATFACNASVAERRRLTDEELRQVMQDLTVSLSLEPDTVSTRTNRIKIGQMYGRWQQVAEDYAILAAKEPRHPDLLAGQGRALVELFRFDEALVVLRRAQKLAPKDPTIKNLIAQAEGGVAVQGR